MRSVTTGFTRALLLRSVRAFLLLCLGWAVGLLTRVVEGLAGTSIAFVFVCCVWAFWLYVAWDFGYKSDQEFGRLTGAAVACFLAYSLVFCVLAEAVPYYVLFGQLPFGTPWYALRLLGWLAIFAASGWFGVARAKRDMLRRGGE